ncbi:MAG: Methenyltetrahydrofolate cyclohydrolase / Methylenetetrahydrofolate dehydrogenase (NADP+) [Candidatus Kapaibacterium sp.]|nr:MAG: Methenyltetrahydrofolate cyclohydrolase / Methylenetetrahydrofolate dehydrogenase (NADP+) [Candidatus Kapabacteria bacterium]
MPIIIDGKLVSSKILDEIRAKTAELKSQKGITPGLALLLVGNNPASLTYVNSKRKACTELGFYSIVEHLTEDTPEEKVLNLIEEWNNDPKIHGILVQLPLPKHINELKTTLKIKPSKDVDGFHPENFGRLVIGLPGFRPCTPAGIVELLKHYQIDTFGKHVVVVGRSNIVGKPIANMLYQKAPNANAIVTICHTAAKDLRQYTRLADILVVAAGSPNFITSDFVKDGVVVIDVGINRIEDSSSKKGYKLVGDVDFNSVAPKAYAITPVPGGVGPMTIAMLMKNTYLSASGEITYEA